MSEFQTQDVERLRLNRQHLSPVEADIIGSGDRVAIDTDEGKTTYLVGSSTGKEKGIRELLDEHFDLAITPLEVQHGASIDQVRKIRKDMKEDNGMVGIFKPEVLVDFMMKGISLKLRYSDIDDKGRMTNVPIGFMQGDNAYQLTQKELEDLTLTDTYAGRLVLGQSDDPSVAVFNFSNKQ